ncbi:hypothetical protein TRVA0_027S00232 [Trichomonascus vanleenenianus]|uniref:basic helix-loop-helix domain-containing protein n=1 Tax=Trichomonascus vanleenenianus TaxID=2268995 RepID=UPI003ECACDB0
MDRIPPLQLPEPALSIPTISDPPPSPPDVPLYKLSSRNSSIRSSSISNGVSKSAPRKIAPLPPGRPVKATLDQLREQKRQARKLAHSDIERRRRNKINEQFDALKDLIPTCTEFKSSSGGDVGLHKLVILQHTVEYIKHLKSCLKELKYDPPPPSYSFPPPPRQCFNSPPISPEDFRRPSSSSTASSDSEESSSRLRIANLLS